MNLGLQRKVRKIYRGMKGVHVCLVNKCLLGHLETMGHRADFDQMGLLVPLCLPT